MTKEFKKKVETEISAICGKIDFKKKKYNYFKALNDNVLATLGFGMATHTDIGHIYINVTIGVLFKDVEELRYKLTGYNGMEFMQPTVGIQIGYLMPQNDFKEWNLIENENNTPAFEDLLKNIQTYGFPYQEKMSCFNNLLQFFERRDIGILHVARDKYLPILYYLKGEKEKGLKVIEETIERMNKRPIDTEFRKGNNPEKVVIPRSDKNKVTAENMQKMLRKLPVGGQILIVGAGYNGNIDPEYLKFAENYKLL